MVSLPTMLATAGRSGCDAIRTWLCSTGASGLVRALVDVGGEVIEGHELHGLVAIVEGRHWQGDPPACQGLAEVFLVQVAKPAFADLLQWHQDVAEDALDQFHGFLAWNWSGRGDGWLHGIPSCGYTSLREI